MQPRLIVLGLDGASFDVMMPWVKTGDLPNIARIMERGSHAILRSTIHPLSPVAWSSFMTGQNPGKHGLINFWHRPGFAYHTELMNGGYLRARTVWSLMNASGYTVGVLNVPFTYPPHQVNGYMISGMDAPAVSPRMFWPPGLYDELLTATGEYLIKPDMIVDSEVDSRRIARHVQNRGAVVRYLLTQRPVDVFMVVFGATDHVQHYCWPLTEQPADIQAQGLAMIRYVYQLVDAEIGACLAQVSGTPDIVLMSDHGFGPSSQRLCLGRWLADQGYLVLDRTGPGTSKPRTNWMFQVVPRGLRNRLRRYLKRRHPDLAARLSMVNWPRTRAFATGTCGNVWINLRGRDPAGCVEPGEEYERLRDELIEGIASIRDPHSDEPLIEKVYRREELYHGSFLDYAPDLIVVPRDYSIEVSPTYTAERLIEPRVPDKRGRVRSGDHRLNGIFAAAGPHIQNLGRVEAFSILDVAPTLLALLGVPIPDDIDGHVVTEILQDVEPLSYEVGQKWNSHDIVEPQSSYSADEAAEIEARLCDLGYL